MFLFFYSSDVVNRAQDLPMSGPKLINLEQNLWSTSSFIHTTILPRGCLHNITIFPKNHSHAPNIHHRNRNRVTPPNHSKLSNYRLFPIRDWGETANVTSYSHRCIVIVIITASKISFLSFFVCW